MAKNEKPKTPEELEKERREKDKKEKEERERKELEKKRKEKEVKEKNRQKRLKKKEQAERKRIKKIIAFPFKLLFQVSTLVTLLFFVFVFFGSHEPIYKSVYNSFIVFTALYLGLGIILVAVFLVFAEKREKELQIEIEEIRRIKREEEEKRLQEMQELENEIKATSASRLEEAKKLRENSLSDSNGFDNIGMMNEEQAFKMPTEMGEHYEDLSYQDIDYDSLEEE